MTPIEWLVLFAVCVAGVVYITWGSGKYKAIREQEELSVLRQQRAFWMHRWLHAKRAKECVIREARRWKAQAEFEQVIAARYQDRFEKVMRRWIDAEKRCLAEVQANNTAFDAGVRAHATGVVNYTGDEPEGVRL